VLDTTHELGIALVAFSPVGRGALCGEITAPEQLGTKDIRLSMPRFSAEHWPANLALIEQLSALAAEAGATPAQLSLAWVLAQGEHLHAIPGTRSVSHFDQNHAAMALDIPAEVIARAGGIINQQTVSGHRYSPMMNASIDTEDY
jgi:aryl-alcohol dehydrogenase-like predicted oxidoreductase